MHKFGKVDPARKMYISDNMNIPVPELSIVIPTGGTGREHIANYMLERYQTVFPEFEVILSENHDPLYNKSKATNEGVDKASNDLLILTDSDVLVMRETVANFYTRIGSGAVRTGWGHSKNISKESTEELLNTKGILTDQRLEITHNGGANSFCMITKSAYTAVNGMDQNFKGWGCEDVAFFRALDAFGLLNRIYSEWYYHLWHPEQEKSERKANGDRWKRYAKAELEELKELISHNKEG